MTAERAELRLVREALETLIAPQVASTVMFEALAGAGGELPEGAEGTRAFVDGPLREALRDRLGEDADATIDHVLATVATITAPSPRPQTARRTASRELEITREIKLDTRPVLVAVVAGGEAFARQLVAALGSSRVAAIAVSDVERLLHQLEVFAPDIVLIDAADFAPIEPDEIALALGKMGPTVVRAIWGADLPFGASVLRALVSRNVPATPIDRREGIDPLLDLIRSRQAPA